jgi:DNA-binding response OmpR family regulator
MTSMLAIEVPRSETTGWPALAEDGLEVLVVEDDEADTFLIRNALRMNPRISRIVMARDGVEALQWLDSGLVSPDLAIVDLHMPRKNGFSLLVELRCRANMEFPTIVLTSSKASADAARSKLRGADCFLTKPDSMEELSWLLSQTIARM